MKIVIPGGRGQIGRILACYFHHGGAEVVVLSREKQGNAPWRTVTWNGNSHGEWQSELEGADILINLAGFSVNCRYHAANRNRILDSRVQSTRLIGEAIERAKNPPRLWLQASTATIYAHRFDAPNDEHTGKLGGNEPNAPDTWRFSIQVAQAWEAAATAYNLPQTRLVLLRSAMTMSPDAGGVFSVLSNLVRKGLGGTNGSGKQFVSWIHEQDFIRAIQWIIDHEQLAGAINICSPNPLPNADFMRILRQAWNVRWGLPASAWMLEIGAVFLRTETELILKSRRVIPARLLASGFEFLYPAWQSAATELVARSRACTDRIGNREIAAAGL